MQHRTHRKRKLLRGPRCRLEQCKLSLTERMSTEPMLMAAQLCGLG